MGLIFHNKSGEVKMMIFPECVRKLRMMTVLIITLTILVAPVSFAADPYVDLDKTATKTGSDTATITLTATGVGTSTTSGADIVFSIDSSGSMSTSDPTDLRMTASKNFVDKMDPTKDQAGVVNWASSVQSSQALTNDFSQVKTVIDQGYASGGTNYDVGIGEAINLLDAGKKTSNTQSIIFLSDGDPSTYTPPGTAGSKVDEAATKGYKIYTVGLGSGIDATILQAIATATGGKYYFAADASALDPIFNEIYQQISSAAGTNVVVTDILQSYIHLISEPTIAPTTKTVNADGTTNLTWNVGTLLVGQTWTTSFNVRSSKLGLLPTNVYPGSGVTYTDVRQVTRTVEFPEVEVQFGEVAEASTSTSVSGKTVPMQETGSPVGLLVVGILAAFGGVIFPKIQK
jgi:Ca-activated chloride channel family protein